MTKRLLATGLALLVMGVAGAYQAVAAPAQALCHVCRVTEGATEEEPVVAVRTHEGVEYGFCSDKCAKAFDADPAAYLPPMFPREAPRFAFTDLTGRAVSNESLAGQVVLLDFWATWCAPCKKSMPELQALHDRFAKKGFTVLGVSIDEGGPDKVKKLVRSKKFSYPIAMDSEKSPAWDSFRVKAIPAAFLIDRQGRIVAQWTGIPPDGKEIESRLETLLQAD